MTKITFRENFHNYSHKAIQQVIDQSIDRPFKHMDGRVIGKVISAKRISNSVVEFEAEIEEGVVSGERA